MAAELPSLDLVNTAECNVSKQTESRLNVKSAIESHRSKHKPDNDLNYRKSKRNSDGQVLQVKFADNLPVPTVERKRAVESGSNSSVNVDHEHYEQWARVPAAGKKVTKSTLLRGIQQLKARLKREEINMEIVGFGKRRNGQGTEQRVSKSEDNNYEIKALKRNVLLTSDKFSEDKYVVRRDRINTAKENIVVKHASPTKNQLKPNAQLIDSGVFKQANDPVSVASETDVRLSRNNERDSAKLRHGVSRIRDRSAFPISVYQPISIGDHVFLINEPIKDGEILNSDKADCRSKRETQKSSMLLLADTSRKNEALNKTSALHVHLDMILGGKTASVTNSFQRSRTTVGRLLPPSRIQKRTQFEVSSAELYDFSQLSEIRHSMADKFFERSQTEFLFPNRSIRNGYKVYNE